MDKPSLHYSQTDSLGRTLLGGCLEQWVCFLKYCRVSWWWKVNLFSEVGKKGSLYSTVLYKIVSMYFVNFCQLTFEIWAWALMANFKQIIKCQCWLNNKYFNTMRQSLKSFQSRPLWHWNNWINIRKTSTNRCNVQPKTDSNHAQQRSHWNTLQENATSKVLAMVAQKGKC